MTTVEWHGEELKARLDERIGECLELAAGDVDDDAHQLCPVDTGLLQSTIRHDVDGKTATIEAGGDIADYAVYVELGTVKAAAQPFLRPPLLSLRWLQRFFE